MERIKLVTGVTDLTDFPVSDYYKDNILEARTINRSGSWWAAILLISDPRNSKPFLSFYRWQLRNGEWKVSKSFTCRSKKQANKIVEIIGELYDQLG